MLAWHCLKLCPVTNAGFLCTGAGDASLTYAGGQGWGWLIVFPDQFIHQASFGAPFEQLCRSGDSHLLPLHHLLMLPEQMH